MQLLRQQIFHYNRLSLSQGTVQIRASSAFNSYFEVRFHRVSFADLINSLFLKRKQNKRKEECEICGKKVLILKSHMKLHERAMAKSE